MIISKNIPHCGVYVFIKLEFILCKKKLQKVDFNDTNNNFLFFKLQNYE